MIRDRFPAMGTTIDVVAADRDALAATQQLFDDLEQQFSRFLPDSELSTINRDPSERVELSPLMAEVMHMASDLRSRTDGLVDPAVGGQLRAWGYDRSFDAMTGPTKAPIDVAPAAVWALEDRWLVRSPGTRFDLGGIVKGWTADRAVESGRALLVSAGGDVRSAVEGAVVEVEDPNGGPATPVELGVGGLATSSVARRRWRVGTEDAHHLIDPNTGAPAITPVVSATVRCDTAVEAEAAAKAVVLGGTAGLAWADRQEWVGSALVAWHDGSVYATRGWEYAA